MMESILQEKRISFKEFEKKIYQFVCGLGQEIARTMLENYDDHLAKNRDRKEYRDKGKRTTTVKTLFGEVTYERRVYQTKTEEGERAYIYLLDSKMQMEKIGLISTNLAEQILQTVTEAPYRSTAEIITNTCGQSISHGGVWEMVQKLGEKISKEEAHAVKEMNADQAKGTKEIPVLFEEMDGVWLNMQGKAHEKAKKHEMKVFTMYEGWEEDPTNKRSKLVGKTVMAGMENSKEFHEKREALIEKTYNVDEIQQRILNGDGGSWIKETYDPDAIFQLDRYHIYQEILRKIADKKAQKDIRELFEEEKIEEMLEYIEMYATSTESPNKTDKTSKKARELYKYLSNNRAGLLPYQKRGIEIPHAPKGMKYKNMGVQENQNCTIITLRMKHRRMRWSVCGANNMAKLLYRRENDELIETIERYTDGFVMTMEMQKVVKNLTAAKAPKRDGKGSGYIDVINHPVPLYGAMMTASRKAFKRWLQ